MQGPSRCPHECNFGPFVHPMSTNRSGALGYFTFRVTADALLSTCLRSRSPDGSVAKKQKVQNTRINPSNTICTATLSYITNPRTSRRCLAPRQGRQIETREEHNCTQDVETQRKKRGRRWEGKKKESRARQVCKLYMIPREPFQRGTISQGLDINKRIRIKTTTEEFEEVLRALGSCRDVIRICIVLESFVS